MKTTLDQTQRIIKPKFNDFLQYGMNSPKQTALRYNKENDRSEEIIYLNRTNDPQESKFKFPDLNSPKGNFLKAKVLLQQQNNMPTYLDNVIREQQPPNHKRQQQFDDARRRIVDLEAKIDNLRNYYRSTEPIQPQKRQRINIFKSRSVEKLPIPFQKEAEKPEVESTEGSSPISSFVTQVAAPVQNLQCASSYTNLNFKQLKFSLPKYYVSSIVSAFCDNIKTTFNQLCKTHLLTSLQLLNTLKNVQKPLHFKPSKVLPPTQKKTIVFDLDETLIHCNETVLQPSDEKLDIPFLTGEIIKVGINVRPWAKECLKELSEMYQIMVFTASHECYGTVVADYLDPTGTIIAARYFRDSCHKTNDGYYIKDLRIINRPLQNVLLIDNAAYSYAFQIENGVPIIPFYNDKSDIELRHLVTFLKGLHGAQDIRKEMCEQLKVNLYPNFTDAKELIKTLYTIQTK